MRADIPLLPLTVEFRRRPLPPLRLTLRGLLLIVAVSGVFFALVGEERRLGRAMSGHAIQAVDVMMKRSPSHDPMPVSRWHSAMSQKYRADFERLDLLLFAFILAAATVIAAGVFGRVVARIQRPNERPVGAGGSGLSTGRGCGTDRRR